MQQVNIFLVLFEKRNLSDVETSFCKAICKSLPRLGFTSNLFNHGRRSVSKRPCDKRNYAYAHAQWCGPGQHKGSVAVQAGAALNSFGCINESLQRMCLQRSPLVVFPPASHLPRSGVPCDKSGMRQSERSINRAISQTPADIRRHRGPCPCCAAPDPSVARSAKGQSIDSDPRKPRDGAGCGPDTPDGQT